MRTVRDIIEDLGGQSAVAKAHNPPLAQSTVQGWVTSNFVPRWRVPALIEIAETQSKSLTENDFPPKDQRLRVVG
jgi:hypothetical protein